MTTPLSKILGNINMKSLVFTMVLSFITIMYWPNVNLLFWMVMVIMLDLITGIFKSLLGGNFVISKGLRKTAVKLGQYIGTITLCVILANVIALNAPGTKESMGIISDPFYAKIQLAMKIIINMVILLIIYTETLSVLENCLEINKTSIFSKYILSKLHKILSLAILHNAIKRLADSTPDVK